MCIRDRIATDVGVDGMESLDITDRHEVMAFVRHHQPDVIVSCAAFTNVDGCETNRDAAFKVNALGARNLAMAAQEVDAKLIHVSTDYVFSGSENGGIALDETAQPAPISAYGSTKLLGEEYVKSLCSRYFIVRTAWLYGYAGKNFVKTICAAAKKYSAVEVDVYKRQMVAILSGIAIVPVVFVTLGAEGLGQGGGFAFMALPQVFAQMPGGVVFGCLFFMLLFLAALTSAISVLESCVAFLTEEFHLSRLKATVVLTIPMAFLSAGYSLSQSSARNLNLPWFDFASGVQMLPMNAVLEKFTDNLMIPLGALGFCLFVGWVWGTRNALAEIEADGSTFRFKRTWSFLVRFLAPAVIALIL